MLYFYCRPDSLRPLLRSDKAGVAFAQSEQCVPEINNNDVSTDIPKV